MAEIFCLSTSDAQTKSPPYDIQTYPVPTKSIIYGAILDVERFSGYWLDLLSVIPPAGIHLVCLVALQPNKNIQKSAKQKPLFPKQSNPPPEPILLHHSSLFDACMGRRFC